MVYPRNAPFQQLYPHGVWVIFLKKKLDKEAKKEKEKGDKTHTSTQERRNKELK